MYTPAFDAHVHASPSSVDRWGSDLDLVELAGRCGVRGFVLKSHHESTAARAVIATQYAQSRSIDCRVYGSVVLNPWMSLTELKRALQLGVRIVWWPSRDETGHAAALPLPHIHDEALALIATYPGVTVATGHLARDAAHLLVQQATGLGLPVVATHPLNPDVGLGLEAALVLAREGAMIEIDALSLRLLRTRGTDSMPLLRTLLRETHQIYACSDGGQVENGEPFVFLQCELEYLAKAGGAEVAEQLVAGADRWLAGAGATDRGRL